MGSSAPAVALAFLQEGVRAAKEGQLQDSLESFNQGLALVPHSAGLLLNRSIVYEQLGNDPSAFNDLDQYLQYAPQDSEQNGIAQKRFIALGVKLSLTHTVLMRMQKLEMLEQWQSAQFYEVLIGFLSLESLSLEASLLHYLQRATELGMLTQSCLENALNIWRLHALTSDTGAQLLSAKDMLTQLAVSTNAPQFILHILLDEIRSKASNEELLHAQSIDFLSLWIKLHPMDAAATEHLIQFLIHQNQFDLAETLFLDLSQRFPQDPNYLLGLSRTRLFKRDVDRAFVVINAALDLDEKNLEVRLHRAKIFQNTLNPQLALVDINQNLQIEADHLPSQIAKVGILTDLGRLDEALALYEKLILLDLPEHDRLTLELDKSFIYRLSGRVDDWAANSEKLAIKYPDDGTVLCNLGWKKIYEGDWGAGFALLERRFSPGLHYFPLQPHIIHAQIPIWSPELLRSPVKGQHLLLCGEEGLGDIVQFIRFIPLLLDKGLHITLVCKEALHALLKHNFPKLRFIASPDLIAELHSQNHQKYDFYGEVMSIPWVLDLKIEDLSSAPYLKALPERIEAMAAFEQSKIQGNQKRPCIGLRWMSSVARSGRTVPLEDLLPLSQMPVDIFGLHHGPIKNPDKALYEQWANFVPTELAIDDLAGLMMNLDCIVTSDTMTAHLAGALGRPTILLKPSFIDWRWPGNSEQSIWYDSMRIIRQSEFKNWQKPVTQLVQMLKEQLQH
jgi:tetratricopeptide (TPR) repeat protein